nr:DUF2835 family protein [Halomonas sp. 707D7]
MRRVVGRDGVRGVFRLTFTDQGRFSAIAPVSSPS